LFKNLDVCLHVFSGRGQSSAVVLPSSSSSAEYHRHHHHHQQQQQQQTVELCSELQLSLTDTDTKNVLPKVILDEL